jgi:hypothetical protein
MVLQTTVFSNTKNTLQENRQSGKRYQRRTAFIVIRWDKKGYDKDTYITISNSKSCLKNEYLKGWHDALAGMVVLKVVRQWRALSYRYG